MSLQLLNIILSAALGPGTHEEATTRSGPHHCCERSAAPSQ